MGLLVTRTREDIRRSNRRTAGKYQVYHDGAAIPKLSGGCVETREPGDNSHPDNNRRIEAGRYPRRTHEGSKYATIDYATLKHRPGIGVGKTAPRYDILFIPVEDLRRALAALILRRLCPMPMLISTRR
jgi:hypothetical protein